MKQKNNLKINLNNQISKPSYLMTINPDKFLQKPNRKTAISIKDRDEINPEMAEIVRKILIKRKKEKKNNNRNNNSMIKSRKVDQLKKFFDDNYNKKHGINKENYYKLNKTLLFDSLHDRMGSDNYQIHYLDYMNKINNGNKSVGKNKMNINNNYSFSRNAKNSNQNEGNLKINKNHIDNYTMAYMTTKYTNSNNNNENYNEFKYNKKLREYEEIYSPKNIKKINIIKNNQYILNLNSITIDVDQINKDKSIMEINCSSLEDEAINSKILSPELVHNSSKKKHIYIQKKIKKKNLDENNDRIPVKSVSKQTPSTKNSMQYDIKLLDNNISNIKPKYIDMNKNNILNNLKMKNKPKDNIRKNKKMLNRSLEHRYKYNINKENNESKFYMTMNNGFFAGNTVNISNINSHLNINDIRREKPKKNLNLNLNQVIQKEIRKDLNASSFIKKEYKQKIINEPKLNKSIVNYKSNYNNINNLNNNNKKQNNFQTYRVKIKNSPIRSRIENNLSTERSNNYKRNKRIINNNNNIYGQNRSLSKDCFQTEPTQKLYYNKTNVITKAPGHGEILSTNTSNKNNLIKAQYFRNKMNEKESNKSKSKEKLLEKNDNNSNDKSNVSNTKLIRTKSTKREYPNMAKFLYGRKQSNDNVNEEEIKSSKSKETKAIKKIENLCKKGYSGPGVKKTNQDNFFIYNNFNNNSNYIYLGVCDGHGIFGQDISGYLVNNLPQNMNNNVIAKGIKNLTTEKITTLSNIFQETFVQTNSALNEDERIDSSYSGSTCVSLLFTPTRIFCINVGDSRGIIGKFNGYEWSTKPLSRDHKPSEPDEMNRILKSGGWVESFRDNYGNFVGPERVWSKNTEGPGLAMSRSFGDEIGHKVGVVVDPEIMEHYFLKEDKFIVLGSDGIWEFIGNDEVVNIVKDYYLENNIEGAIEHLYNEASKRWLMEEKVIDDITIILLFLN